MCKWIYERSYIWTARKIWFMIAKVMHLLSSIFTDYPSCSSMPVTTSTRTVLSVTLVGVTNRTFLLILVWARYENVEAWERSSKCVSQTPHLLLLAKTPARSWEHHTQVSDAQFVSKNDFVIPSTGTPSYWRKWRYWPSHFFQRGEQTKIKDECYSWLSQWIITGTLACTNHRPRFFWSALRIATSFYERARVFFSYYQLIRFVRIDRTSVNRGLPVSDQPRGRDSWGWRKGARPLGTRTIAVHVLSLILHPRMNLKTEEEFESGGLTLKTHQMFSVNNTPEKFNQRRPMVKLVD